MVFSQPLRGRSHAPIPLFARGTNMQNLVIVDTIRHLDPLLKPGTLVTDAGSTKCAIVDLARYTLTHAQFLGGHPMAGKETRGASAAEADLFRGRTWILTPDDDGELHTSAA